MFSEDSNSATDSSSSTLLPMKPNSYNSITNIILCNQVRVEASFTKAEYKRIKGS